MTTQPISFSNETLSQEDILNMVIYDGKLLSNDDLNKIYKIIFDLGKQLEVNAKYLENLHLLINDNFKKGFEIGTYKFSNNPEFKALLIPEICAIKLVYPNYHYSQYLKDRIYPQDLIDLASAIECKKEEKIDSITEKNNITSGLRSSLSYLTDNYLLNINEIKASIAHEFGHIVCQNQTHFHHLAHVFTSLINKIDPGIMILIGAALTLIHWALICDEPRLTTASLLLVLGRLLIPLLLWGFAFIYLQTLPDKFSRDCETCADEFAAKDRTLCKASYDMYLKTKKINKRFSVNSAPSHPSTASRIKFFKNHLGKHYEKLSITQ